jgi:hypothetical protein
MPPNPGPAGPTPVPSPGAFALGAAALAGLIGPLSAADDTLARLDERLRKSPVCAGVLARADAAEACAALWAEGALVPLEDLVLHESGMDVRSPTHDLVRAHAYLRLRRMAAAGDPKTLLTPAGILGLIGRGGGFRGAGGVPQESAQENAQERAPESGRGRGQGAREGANEEAGEGSGAQSAAPDLSELGRTRAPRFAAAEKPGAPPPAVEPELAPLRQPSKAPAPAAVAKDPFVYDETWNEAEKLAGWHAGMAEVDNLPPLLGALLLAHAWHADEPIQRQARLAPLLAGLYLRARGRTKTHLASFYLGLRRLRPQERPHTRLDHLRQGLAIVEAGAREGLAQHDRLILARALLVRKCRGRRETSHLPALAELLLEAPLVSVAMIAQRLAISPQAAQILVGNLGASLREITGRKRYRAWTIG